MTTSAAANEMCEMIEVLSPPRQANNYKKSKCKTCEDLRIETIAATPEGQTLRLDGLTITDRIHQLHAKLEQLMTDINETKVFTLADCFVRRMEKQ